MSKANAPILITGASGQVGSAVVRLAGGRGLGVVGLARRELDVSDRRRVDEAIRSHRPAVVINCAAFTDVDAAEDHPEDARAVNASGAAHLAAACDRVGIPLIHISTDYVFDGTAGRPYGEEDSVNPINAYGRTKLEGEEAVRAALDRHLIIRTSWVFAPGHGNFVSTILRLAREREELRVVVDQVGSPTPAGALAAVLLDLAARASGGEELPWGTFHVAGEPPASRFELAEAVVDAVHADDLACRRIIPVESDAFPTPARRPANTSLDCSKAHSSLRLAGIAWRTAVIGPAR